MPRYIVHFIKIIRLFFAFFLSIFVAVVLIKVANVLGFMQEREFRQIYAFGSILSFNLMFVHIALFSFPYFALSVFIGEIWVVRELMYYVSVWGCVALYGVSQLRPRFSVLMQPTIVVVIVAALLAGFVYWRLMGKYAGLRPH